MQRVPPGPEEQSFTSIDGDPHLYPPLQTPDTGLFDKAIAHAKALGYACSWDGYRFIIAPPNVLPFVIENKAYSLNPDRAGVSLFRYLQGLAAPGESKYSKTGPAQVHSLLGLRGWNSEYDLSGRHISEKSG